MVAGVAVSVEDAEVLMETTEHRSTADAAQQSYRVQIAFVCFASVAALLYFTCLLQLQTCRLPRDLFPAGCKSCGVFADTGEENHLQAHTGL